MMATNNTATERHELKEAIESISALARKPLEDAAEVKTVELFDLPYYMNRCGVPVPVQAPTTAKPVRHTINSLDGLIEMVKHEGLEVALPDRYAQLEVHAESYHPHLFVEVSNYYQVFVYTDNLNFDCCHYTLYEAAVTMERFRPGKEYGHEEMMIALRSIFQSTEDRDYLLNMLASVTSEATVTSNDNGLNQQVTVNKGIANIQRERVKSIVRLKPYRTFPEVEQPESEFLVRLSTDSEGGIRVALYEADGGMWKLDACRAVAAYLRSYLEKEIEAGRVTVMA